MLETRHTRSLWYVVPTGKDNFIVSAGRPNMVPAGRTIVSPGSIIFGPACDYISLITILNSSKDLARADPYQWLSELHESPLDKKNKDSQSAQTTHRPKPDDEDNKLSFSDSTSKNMSHAESQASPHLLLYLMLHPSSKARSHSSGHFARECRAKWGNEKRYSSFKIPELGKKEADTKALITVDTLENWKEHESGDDEGFAPKEYGMVAGCGCWLNSEVQAYKNSLKTLEKQKRIYQKNQLGYEEKIRVLSIELENTTNLLKHSERINVEAEIAKKDLQTKLNNHLAKTEKWTSSSKNLFRLIDSSMSVRTKVGLGFDKYIRESELGWDDSAFSVFTTNSEEVEGRLLFNRFAKVDSMKAVPPPLSGDYTPLSDHIDLDESQMSYGTKSSTSGDSNSVSNDFVSCDNSDKSSKVNTNDFASSDSSVRSLEPKLNDSTSCASTSSISTSESEAEIESNFVPQAVLLRTGKINIPPAIPQPVPTSKLKVPAPVPTGRQNRPFPVPTDRGYSPSVTSGWWKNEVFKLSRHGMEHGLELRQKK
ncbi:hypothetical protein Tco_0939253 [Tanacetum coccineum]|uniref:Uncharacterized protein n=1 Tax=Tanacetum coccineum TaxID=301880 RepID=A0ABQ5DM55_9ASTR